MHSIANKLGNKWQFVFVLVVVTIIVGFLVSFGGFEQDCIKQFNDASGEGLCYKSRSTRLNDELKIVDALGNWEPVFEERYDANFPHALGKSIAFKGAGEWVNTNTAEVTSEKYHRVQDVEMRYSELPFTLNYLHAQHTGPNAKLAIVIHGHSSTRWKILGLDNIDYTGEIGNWFYNQGYDVIAPAMTDDGERSAVIHQNLLITGNTIYGVWITQICDLLEWAREDGNYSEVVLYGISNGGKIANYSSILCNGFDIVIVDDILQDLRKSLYEKSRRKIFKKTYMFANFGNHIQINTYSNLLLHVNNKTIFILNNETISEIEKIVNNIKKNEKYTVIEKQSKLHTPELNLIERALEKIEK